MFDSDTNKNSTVKYLDTRNPFARLLVFYESVRSEKLNSEDLVKVLAVHNELHV